jgi:hypothetical protein
VEEVWFLLEEEILKKNEERQQLVFAHHLLLKERNDLREMWIRERVEYDALNGG